MERWQYFAHNIAAKGLRSVEIDSQQITNVMNYYANEGWEFMNAATTVIENGLRMTMTLFFKRRIHI